MRATLEAEAEELGPQILHERLTEIDPRAAAKIEPTNTRRVVRALEVIELTGELFSDNDSFDRYESVYELAVAGLTRPRKELYELIDERVERMLTRGLIDETKGLLGLGFGPTAAQALGYRQVLEHPDADYGVLRDEIVRATKRFARRQESWFRADPRAVVLGVGARVCRGPGWFFPGQATVEHMNFAKYQGTGNDFVMVNDAADELTLTPEIARSLCDRRFGVGADGVIRVAPGDEADFLMDYVNSDGSVSEICGNGIRCLAVFARAEGLTAKDEITVETGAGTRTVTVQGDGHVRVDMSAPIFEPERVPFDGGGNDPLHSKIEVDGDVHEVAVLSMGNPHAVLFIEDPKVAPVTTLGPRLESHLSFPHGANVEFVTVESPQRLVMRVWERGSRRDHGVRNRGVRRGRGGALVARHRGARHRCPGGRRALHRVVGFHHLRGPRIHDGPRGRGVPRPGRPLTTPQRCGRGAPR